MYLVKFDTKVSHFESALLIPFTCGAVELMLTK
jgi:hypothetical protein